MDKPTISLSFIFGGRPPPPRRRGVKAWLLEWLPAGVDVKKFAGCNRDSRSAEVAGILQPRLAWETDDVARSIFFAVRLEPAAMLAFRDAGRSEVSPFMPTFPFAWTARFPGDAKPHGGPYREWFVLGGSPGLYGRPVERLRAVTDGTLHWTEQESACKSQGICYTDTP